MALIVKKGPHDEAVKEALWAVYDRCGELEEELADACGSYNPGSCALGTIRNEIENMVECLGKTWVEDEQPGPDAKFSLSQNEDGVWIATRKRKLAK